MGDTEGFRGLVIDLLMQSPGELLLMAPVAPGLKPQGTRLYWSDIELARPPKSRASVPVILRKTFLPQEN